MAKSFLHLYNLDGAHVFSTALVSPSSSPLPDRIEEALRARLTGATVSRSILVALSDQHGITDAGCFAWGPLVGLWFLSSEPALPRRLPADLITGVWQSTSDGFPTGEPLVAEVSPAGSSFPAGGNQ